MSLNIPQMEIESIFPRDKSLITKNFFRYVFESDVLETTTFFKDLYVLGDTYLKDINATNLTLTDDISLITPSTSTTGLIKKGLNAWMHDFKHPTGLTQIPAGRNLFWGINAGNFTMGSTAIASGEASYNVGIGAGAFFSNTIGYGCIAIGNNALYENTTGFYNVAIGVSAAAENLTGNSNCAIGVRSSVDNESGNYNVSVGSYSLENNTSGESNVAVGNSALRYSTENYNVGIGRNAGRYFASTSPKSTGEKCVYLGYLTKASANDQDNEIVIGAEAVGNGSNTLTLGNSSITDIYRPNVDKSLWLGAEAISAAGASAATRTTNATGFVVLSFANNLARYCQLNIQLPPDMDRSVASYLNIGWSSPATSKDCVWGWGYLAVSEDEDTEAAATTGSGVFGCSATADGFTTDSILTFGANTFSSTDVCVHLYIWRAGAAVADTLSDVAELHGACLSYKANKII